MSEPLSPFIARYADLGSGQPVADAGSEGGSATATPKSLADQAKKAGARRAKLVSGQGGFFMNRSRLPAGFRIPPHSHNHNEMLVILSGGCEFDDGFAALNADDTIVIHAKTKYGFTCGPEGMEFLTIRLGEASVELE